MNEERLAVDVKRAAEMLSVSTRSIQNFLRLKILPRRKIGRRTVIPVRALESFLRHDHASPSPRRERASASPLNREMEP